MSGMEAACSKIAQGILDMDSPTWEDVRGLVNSTCSQMSLNRIPRKEEILSAAGPAGYSRLRGILLKKPVKTGSGVAVVALMPKPFACPHGRCTYCPGGDTVPNSYTGKEPVALSAIEHDYDPYRQIANRIEQLRAYGHTPTKMELVVVGGTFLFMPERYRHDFIKSCYDALNGTVSDSLESAKKANQTAAVRSVGLTIETKPDYCKREHIDTMLDYGVTRVEIGVQTLHQRAYGLVNRGHTLEDVFESFQTARDAGLKIVAHMMPGLPTLSPQDDMDDFDRLFDDPRLRPDMLKVYPTLVLRGTPLHDAYVSGHYRPYSDDDMLDVLSHLKGRVPPWVRIMRVQREISPDDIVAGPRQGNLRQRVREKMAQRGMYCRCIRCREPTGGASAVSLEKTEYEASGGREVFLSYVDDGNNIHGFLRLRHPGASAHRPEVEDSALVRELHVYGRSLEMGERGGIQHLGLGKGLLSEAERISSKEGYRNILVISAVGTRQYYSRMGYSLYGPYMQKRL